MTTDTTPTAYYFVEGQKTTWEAEEFHWVADWLKEQEDAPGAEAEAEKGHASDQPSGGTPVQAEKGHAGEKATQGSGGSTQKLWSAPDPARKKAPRSSAGQPIVRDTNKDVLEDWSSESDTMAHRIRAVRGRERTPEPDRQRAREETQRKMQARQAEDKKIFDGLRRRYKRQAAENEADLMARIWETERAQVVKLSERWVENVANVRAPSGARRNRQLQTSNAALDDLRERRQTVRSLQGALKRAGWLPARRAGRVPDFPQAYHSLRDEGALDPSCPSRHSYVVAVDREDAEAWIVDPLHLQPAQDPGVSFQRAGFTVHAVQAPWPEKVAQKQNCSYLAVKTASAFMYRPTDEWRIPKPGDLFDKDKSMTEQHREEQRSTL